jgi:hypothetical protein
MFYATAETPYDGVFMAWFDDIAAAQAALTSPVAQSEVIPDEENFLNPKYLHLMVAREHWIIGP